MKLTVDEKLSHKEWRKLVKKQQRKRHRMAKALFNENLKYEELALLMKDSEYTAKQEEADNLAREAELIQTDLSIKQREIWMKRDEEEHQLFLVKKQGNMKLLINQPQSKIKTCAVHNGEKQEKIIEKTVCISEKDEIVSEVQNPEPPKGYRNDSSIAPTVCPFFKKTGACRFGPLCSREHLCPNTSRTILFTNMYTSFCIHEELIDDHDSDLTLEYSETEILQHFRDFYFDVLGEFRKFGKVIQLKVCSNKSSHLRGNVYVQYDIENSARNAFHLLNGRWYAGKQLSCQFCPIEHWNSAICGLFRTKRCPKGDHCNFLHVYRNPGNAFYNADRNTRQRLSEESVNSRYITKENSHYYERLDTKHSISKIRKEKTHSPIRKRRKNGKDHSSLLRKSKSPHVKRRKSISPHRQREKSKSSDRKRKKFKSPDRKRKKSKH